MKKVESIKENFEFKRVYRRGKTSSDAFLAIYCFKNFEKKNRLGVTVSNKIAKAVKRNKIKRRIKSAYTQNREHIKKGVDIVVVSRTRANFAEYKQIEKSLIHNLKKLNVWTDENVENNT